MIEQKEVIKMDMYQKRKIRAEKKNNDSQKSLPSTSINWVRRIYGKLPKSIENTDILTLNILHILIKL